MIETAALGIGYFIMIVGGLALAVAIAWFAVEAWWKKWCDVKFLREFIVWKRSQGSIPE